MPGRFLRHQAIFSQHGKCRCTKDTPTDFRSLTCYLRYLKITLPPHSHTQTNCRQDTHCRSWSQLLAKARNRKVTHVTVGVPQWESHSGTQLNRAQPEKRERWLTSTGKGRMPDHNFAELLQRQFDRYQVTATPSTALYSSFVASKAVSTLYRIQCARETSRANPPDMHPAVTMHTPACRLTPSLPTQLSSGVHARCSRRYRQAFRCRAKQPVRYPAAPDWISLAHCRLKQRILSGNFSTSRLKSPWSVCGRRRAPQSSLKRQGEQNSKQTTK